MWHARSLFPNQGLNPCPMQWKHGVLTTRLPGKSQSQPFTYIVIGHPDYGVFILSVAWGFSAPEPLGNTSLMLLLLLGMSVSQASLQSWRGFSWWECFIYLTSLTLGNSHDSTARMSVKTLCRPARGSSCSATRQLSVVFAASPLSWGHLGNPCLYVQTVPSLHYDALLETVLKRRLRNSRLNCPNNVITDSLLLNKVSASNQSREGQTVVLKSKDTTIHHH